MKLWLTCFIVLLALLRGGQWLAQVALPLPVILLGGAALAIISNGPTLLEQVPFSQLLNLSSSKGSLPKSGSEAISQDS